MKAQWSYYPEYPPTHGGLYLVTYDDEETVDLDLYSAKGWSSREEGQKVIAWMRLPNPCRRSRKE